MSQRNRKLNLIDRAFDRVENKKVATLESSELGVQAVILHQKPYKEIAELCLAKAIEVLASILEDIENGDVAEENIIAARHIVNKYIDTVE